MRRFFLVTWVLLGVGTACSSSDGGKVPTTPDPGAGSPEPMNGQTGSPGACQCDNDAQCADPLIEGLNSLKVPGHHDWHFVGSQCVSRDTQDGRFFAHPTACLCHRAFGDGGDDYAPENDLIVGNKPLCDLEGRSNDCLYGCQEFPGCDPADTASCETVCADLGARIEQDEARTFDVELRTSKCTSDSCNCHSVLRIEDRCYANFGPAQKVYDCALSDAAILADAYPPTYVSDPSQTRQLDPNAPNWCE